MENLDLIKVLDGCPQDTEFYSDTFGVLRFRGIDTSIEYPLVFMDAHGNIRFFTSNGKFFISSSSNCKLSIFPSDTQRNWSKFERFWDKPKIERFDPKTLKPFDKVIVRGSKLAIWSIDLFAKYLGNKGFCPIRCLKSSYVCCIPYNDETKHLIGTTEEAPTYYRYWEEQS